jgi:hypothetical protein
VAAEPTLRARVAQQGMELARTKYNWEQFGRQVAQVFQDLIR